MSSWFRCVFLFFAVLTVISLAGCSPDGQPDDEKEPHFLLGKSRVQAMDFQGAVEAFEESLDVNPHSAAAHFELAWLYDEKESDPAAAIYHYQQYLKYNPNASNADVVRGRINTCKRQLAADVLSLPDAPAAQQQLEKLEEQNRQLQDELAKWRAWYASQTADSNAVITVPTAPLTVPATPAASVDNVAPAPARQVIAPSRVTNVSSMPAARVRSHTVTRGETAAAICRRYGIRLSALQSANPGVNLGRIRVGQVLNLPP